MMTIPHDVEQRVRDYFAALLPPHTARAAVTDVLDRLAPDASPTAVFGAAHDALQARVRVAPEVEADVLVEEAGLSVHDAATVLGLREPQVRAALDAAAAAAAELDRNFSRPAAPVESGTDRLGVDAAEQRVLIVVDEEPDPDALETIERSRAGAVVVLVLAVVIAIAALVVAAQGT